MGKKNLVTEYSDSSIVIDLHILWRRTKIISSDMWQLSMPCMLVVLVPYFYIGKCDHKDIITKQLAHLESQGLVIAKHANNKVGGGYVW
jgi:hypothetical protein